jgi:hypothetical protein
LELTALRIGFEEGLYSRDDVRAWVDREIAAREQLAPEILELATMAHKPDQEVVALLKGLEPETSAEDEALMELAALGELYRQGKGSLATTISRLYCLANSGKGLSEDQCSAIYHLECALDLVDCGIGIVDEVRVELEEFLASYPPIEGNAPSVPAGERA